MDFFKQYKNEIIKNNNRIKKQNHLKWKNKNIKKYYRYVTLETGIIILLALKKNKWITSKKLIQITGKSRKTVFRLITVLENTGIPIVVQKDEKNMNNFKLSSHWWETLKY